MCVKGKILLGLTLFGQHTGMSSARGTPLAPWRVFICRGYQGYCRYWVHKFDTVIN